MDEKQTTDEHTRETPRAEPAVPETTGQTPAPAGTGLDTNVAGALSYILGALTGILFLVIDGQRPFVRFHAMQAITVTVGMVVLSIALMVVSAVLAVVPILGWLIGLLLSLGLSAGGLVLWLYLMYRAWQGDEWEVPVAGKWARKFADQR
ncbi:MAG: DUF4870 domain-containing protein [Gemmatimonadota bacterium]